MKSVRRAGFLALVPFALFAPGAQAQTYGSIGFGAAKPVSDLGDLYNTGYTVRGQVGFSLVFLDAHIQTGWTNFPVASKGSDLDNLNIYHAGAGARLGLGFIWVGANGAYFFGDGDQGIGWFPELGLKFWKVEGVVDFRIDGDEKWGAARVGLRF